MELLINYLKQNEVEYKRNFKLSAISAIRIGGAAKIVIFPHSIEQLIKVVDYIYDSRIRYKILGRMSNVLPSDNGYDGAVIFTHRIGQIEIMNGYAVAECGASITAIISRLAERSLSGMEKLFGIPSSCGGAVYGNAGAFGCDISSVLLYAEAYSPSLKKRIILSNADLGFSYRNSALKSSGMVLLSSAFAYKRSDSRLIRAGLREIKEKRTSTQPYGMPSLGSTFKREGSIPVSRLIDELGLKGFRIGGAEISKKHAGFIVNSGGALASDYYALVQFIKHKVFEKYGFYPTEEIEYI